MTTRHVPEMFGIRRGPHNETNREARENQRADVVGQHLHLIESAPKLSPEHVDAIHRYTGSGYDDVNPMLRHGVGVNHEPTKRLNANLTNAVETRGKPADHEMHTYAGMSGEHVFSGHVGGGQYETKAWTSTSISPHVAAGFGDDKRYGDADTHIAHFQIPKGFKRWLYVDHHSGNPGEKELLLPPNVRMTHTGSQTITHNDKSSTVIHSFKINHKEL